MKLMQWAEFRLVPVGTFFQDWSPHVLGDLMIFGGDWGNDYLEAPALPQAILGTNLAAGHALKEAGMLFEMPSGYGRNGMYDLGKRYWLVWEQEDRERLAKWLLDPSCGASEQNDEDLLMQVPEVIAQATL